MGNRLLFRWMLPVCLALVAGVSDADIPGYPATVQEMDSREVALLPRYCIYTQLFRDKVPGGGNREQIGRLTRQMGPTFVHLHHYCWGLMRVNRAMLLARTPQDKRSNLAGSIEEFNYVIDRAPEDFVLLPEILAKRGETLIRLDRAGAGLLDLQRAIRLKADYAPAYAIISDYYSGRGETSKAREWLEKGLSASPRNRALTDRMAKLNASRGKRN